MRSRLALALAAAAFVVDAAPKGSLLAGAARIDITPETPMPMSGYAGRTGPFQGIHDRLYVRTIVAGDGSARAALIVCDLSSISHVFWETVVARIHGDTGIPREHILLAATHTHGGPTLGPLSDDDTAGSPSFARELENKIAGSVRRALERLEPARMGFGTGQNYVNSNRRARMAGGGFWLGYSPDGPSDKTVAVVKFEIEAGRPLAVFINYGVHGTVLGARNYQITADLPGATSAFVERELEPAVAIWTSGAAGDQNPIYRANTDFPPLDALGRVLGEEVLRVARSIKTSPVMRIAGAQRVIDCAGRKATHGGGRRADLNYEFADAAPVPIRLSLVMLNHVAFAGVSGEVLTNIGQRLKVESPFAATLMVTHANGSSGYLPDDDAYQILSYETVVTRVKPGCAENRIVNGLLDLMDGM
jgi:hypothetical protein